jgi:hypothetical protein
VATLFPLPYFCWVSKILHLKQGLDFTKQVFLT